MSSDERLILTIQSVFGEGLTELSDEDGLNSVPGWDSAGHLNLIMAIEAEYDVEFATKEFGELISIGALRKRLSDS